MGGIDLFVYVNPPSKLPQIPQLAYCRKGNTCLVFYKEVLTVPSLSWSCLTARKFLDLTDYQNLRHPS